MDREFNRLISLYQSLKSMTNMGWIREFKFNWHREDNVLDVYITPVQEVKYINISVK